MKWRLLQDGPASGAWNMAVDEAVARQVGLGASPPTLRLYRWEPACVSLGYFQPYADVNAGACREQGVDIVRRPTGGRAVLHDREITYSVSLPLSLVPESVSESYLHLSQGLLEAFRIMGLEARLAARPLKGLGSGACFDAPSLQEILVSGKKAVGSAQVRRWGSLLQHGSVPLHFDAGLVASLLSATPESARRLTSVLQHKATGICDALGREVREGEMEGTLVEGFGTALGIELVSSSLSAAEKDLADNLFKDKYGNRRWNEDKVDVTVKSDVPAISG